MGIQGNKKKSPALFFLMCFVVVLIITLIANRRSTLAKEIKIPLNNGIAGLATYGNYLVALSLDNKAYIFDWNNLSNKYQTIPVQFDQMVLLNNGIIASAAKYNSTSLVLTSLNGSAQQKEISLGREEKKTFLNASRNPNTLLLTVAQAKAGQQNQTTLSIYLVDPNSDFLHTAFKTDIDIDINQRISTAVSDDGQLVSLCGSKKGHCWIALCSIREQKIVWEKEMPAPAVFFNSVFSPDAKLIFARGGDCTVYKFETSSGQSASQFLATKENENTEKNQHVQSVRVSSDGRLTGAVVKSTLYVWDSTGKVIFSKGLDHKVVSSMVFSPDAKFAATSDMRQGGIIKIWQLPGQ
jgi:hypothetical protein